LEALLWEGDSIFSHPVVLISQQQIVVFFKGQHFEMYGASRSSIIRGRGGGPQLISCFTSYGIGGRCLMYVLYCNDWSKNYTKDCIKIASV